MNKLKNIQQFILSLAYKSVGFLSIFIFGFLSILSLNSRGYMPLNLKQELVLYKHDYLFYLYILGAFCTLFLIVKFIRKIPNALLFFIFSILYLGFGTFLSLGVGEQLRSDPHYLFKTAIEVNSGDYSSFEMLSHRNYMATFPNQMGLLTLFRLYAYVTTDPSYLFLLQVIMMVIANFLLWKITHLIFGNKEIDKMVILLSHLFIPSLLLTVWVYGDIPGLLFILVSLHSYILYRKKNNIFWIFVTIVFLSLACVVRANYLVFLIMLIILELISLLQKPTIYKLIIILIFPFSYISVENSVHRYYENKIGYEITYPPQKAWIVMGLSDNVSSPGYWDGYTSYIREWTGYDDKKTEERVNHDLAERINVLTSDLNYSQNFIYRKLQATWNEPTLQSVFVGPLEVYEQFIKKSSLKNLYNDGMLYSLYNQYMSIFMAVIFTSCFIWALYIFFSKPRNYNFLILIPFIYLIGGFIFHMFWEIKSRYVFPYVYLLLPITAATVYLLSKKIFRRST